MFYRPHYTAIQSSSTVCIAGLAGLVVSERWNRHLPGWHKVLWMCVCSRIYKLLLRWWVISVCIRAQSKWAIAFANAIMTWLTNGYHCSSHWIKGDNWVFRNSSWADNLDKFAKFSCLICHILSKLKLLNISKFKLILFHCRMP